MMDGGLLAWQGVFIFVAVATLAPILTMVFLRHQRHMVTARAATAQDAAYRELAAATTAEITRMANEIAALNQAVGEVQRLLREVG
jgi:HAMP domain-containing protein